MELTFLGTGCAAVNRRYNTCFLVRSPSGSLLVDSGGGSQILNLLHEAGQDPKDMDALFLSHSHCDHILGAVWVIWVIGRQMSRTGRPFSIYGARETLGDLERICRMTLSNQATRWFGSKILFHPLEDGDAFSCAGNPMTAFDIRSAQIRQFGFLIHLPGGGKLCFAGDELLRPACEHWAEGADWLLSEAFCLYEDRAIYRPYEKHHATVLDAARCAQRLGVQNLVLYHTIDYPEGRRARMTAEAQSVYSGQIYVPEDLETIDICQKGSPSP